MTLSVRLLAAMAVVGWGDGSADYEAARAKAGGGPDGHVRLALWCERHGLDEERARNLALAVKERPDDARVRGLLGMVKVDGRWRDAAEAAEGPVPDGLARYNARREAVNPQSAEDHWQLALWCERRGLKPETRAHLMEVIRLEPSREAAWRQLGYRRHKGRWMTPAQIEVAIADAQARREADKHWGPELGRLLTRIRKGGDAAAEAEAALVAVRDPRAVPKLWEVFVVRSRRAEDHARAARVLAGIDSTEATLRLVRLAVSSPNPPVSSSAAEALRRRDPREVIDSLIASLRVPLAFQVVPGAGGVVGELQVEGRAFNLERFYVLREDYNPLFELNAQPASRISIGSLPGVAVTQTTTPARAVPDYTSARLNAQAAILRDAAMLERFNASVIAANERIHTLLRELTGHVAEAGPLLKEAHAGGNPPAANRPDRVRIRAERLKKEEDSARRHDALKAEYDAQYAEALMAFRMATSSREMGAASLRMSELGQRFSAAVLAEVRARQAAPAEEARQLAWVEKLAVTRREEARNKAWRRWWAGERGYSNEEPEPRPRGTIVEVQSFEVPVVIIPAETTMSTGMAVRQGPMHCSCFAAGTLVHTRTGCRPIEDLKVGDLVLSRDPATGALEYQPITAIHHRRPAPTLRVAVGGETFVVTAIHRFWKAGIGWAMARDLKPGDSIRTVDGIKAVESVRPDEIVPVYNLDVDRTRTFLVGRAGALVHDDHLPEIVTAAFDAVPELVAARTK